MQKARKDPVFHRMAELGQNHLWRWGLGLLAVMLAFGLGNLPLILAVEARATELGLDRAALDEAVASGGLAALGFSDLTSLLLTLLPFVPVLPALFLVARWIHHRPLRSILTARARFDWVRVGVGAGLWVLFAIIAAWAVLPPEAIRWSFDAPLFWPGLALICLLLPLQVLAEEAIFRGYILQGVARFAARALWPMAISVVLFVLPHLANPELDNRMLRILPVYASLGLIFTALAIADNGLELPFGVHLGNNLFATLVLNATDGAIPAPSLYKTTVAEIYQHLPVLTALTALALVPLHLIYRPEWSRLWRSPGVS